ncbi:sulfur carrier protein ThiS [Fodinibius salsisoli]|uniref:Sulfur carrier protein ThiS n=1 Tax=Fodinibius salsisoli TaxID=2820877 RepID=A0ABT3PM07_9BACT|nr:sulfur carrier protein ThiS [Fodinibius salsisoli]MCW9706961.1 sulfur carrier protein ThiS [Fodinibius salsisoli]
MDIKLNGNSTQTNAQTVKELLKETGQDLEAGGMAVAVNESVVAKEQWSARRLEEGDRVEVIRATQGG